MQMPTIRRGYADTADGQLHYRCTPGFPAQPAELLMMHWAPGSSRMLEPLLAALAARGIVAVAFDLPGFGQSLKPRAFWGPVEMADNLLAAIGTLQAAPLVVHGGHLSGDVAVEMALRAPRRVQALVLDGVYACTSEETAALLANYAGLTPRMREGDAHERFLWQATCALLHEWNPRFVATPQAMPEIYATMADYLQMGYEAMRAWLEAEGPPPPSRILERIALLEVPILVLGAQEESLRPSFARALAANRRARGHEFPGNHPVFTPARADEFAGVVADFMRSARSR